jgi:4-diphosphocytidyl-2-C-methyl-D-erythritol kinase
MADGETAYAKINLALHVRRRRADGYHDIETLFAFAADGDALSVTASDVLSLAVDGPFAAGLGGDDNLVLSAARGLADAYGVTAGAVLRLDKRLPVASGIGGGSADAAAALRLLTRHWRLPSDDGRVAALAAALGADVPACLASIIARGEGRGDALVGALVGAGDALAGMPLLLVNPRLPLATGPVFAAWDGVDRGALAQGDALAVARAGRNDLELPARTLCPAIDDVMTALAAQPGVVLARMSGSGATCFALFDDVTARDRAAAAMMAPGWWCLATTLR